MTTEYQGIFTALTTPYDQDEIAPERLRENIEKYNQWGLAGYVVGGSTGENVLLTDDECLKLVEIAREASAPGRKLIAGTARASVRQTISFTNQAADLGADAALIVLPHYYKGLMSPDALRAYFLSVADKAKIPIIIYSIPQNTGVTPSPGLIIELSQHSNILGIKDSSGNLTLLQEAYPCMAPGSMFLLGAGSILLPGLHLGASGGILTLGAVAPELCVRLYELFQAEDWDKGWHLQMDLVPLNQAITKYHGVPGAKHALDLRGYYGGPCRLPLLPLDDQAKQKIQTILEKLQLI
ncbi:MAG: dihydrodipicolinate synthase family protein [Candidatus Aminicenantaceae bacterium]